MNFRTTISVPAIVVLSVLSIPLDAAAQTAASESRSVRDRAEANLITIDVPGALDTSPGGINPAGEIAGSYVDLNFNSHGFLREPNGTFITIDVPGSSDTRGGPINPAGEIAGSYTDANFAEHGFLRKRNGTIITFDAPGAGTTTSPQGTLPTSISPAGEISGSYVDENFVSHGFLRKGDGSIISFDAPGVGPGGGPNQDGTHALTINPAGAITGYYQDAQEAIHGFLREPDGTFTTFDAPGAATTMADFGTLAISINPAGVITGYYSDGSQPPGSSQIVYHGFVRNPDGTFTTFDAPGAVATFPSSNNPAGVIVGQYSDSNEVNHGFLRRQDGSITTFDAPGAGTNEFDGTFPRSINPAGAITGETQVGPTTHGFLRIPNAK